MDLREPWYFLSAKPDTEFYFMRKDRRGSRNKEPTHKPMFFPSRLGCLKRYIKLYYPGTKTIKKHLKPTKPKVKRKPRAGKSPKLFPPTRGLRRGAIYRRSPDRRAPVTTAMKTRAMKSKTAPVTTVMKTRAMKSKTDPVTTAMKTRAMKSKTSTVRKSRKK